MRRIRVVLSLVLTYLSCAFPAHAQNAEYTKRFDHGVSAFKHADYTAALNNFLSIYESETAEARLIYNIGITYYKLGKFKESIKYLRTSAREAPFEFLSLFNIALAEIKLAQPRVAANTVLKLEKIVRSNSERKLLYKIIRALPAEDQLFIRRKQTAKWTTKFAAGIGYSDNVALVEATEDAVDSKNDDAYLKTAFSGRAWYKQQLFFDMDLYLLNYDDISRYDYVQYAPGFGYMDHDKRYSINTRILFSSLDGGAFLNGYSLNVSYEPVVNLGSSWKTGALVTHYTAGKSKYQYLEGEQYDLFVKYSLLRFGTAYAWQYWWQISDRDDYHANSERITSYSPQRHKMVLQVNTSLGMRSKLSGNVYYRMSHYRDKNRVSENVLTKRQDDRSGVGLSYAYSINKNLWLMTEFEYTKNSSNIDQYQYSVNDFSVNILWRN